MNYAQPIIAPDLREKPRSPVNSNVRCHQQRQLSEIQMSAKEASTPESMKYVIGFCIGSVGAALLGAGLWFALGYGVLGAFIAHFVPQS